MVMDTRHCIGCHSCTIACKIRNELPTYMIYNPVTTDGPHGTVITSYSIHYTKLYDATVCRFL